MAANLGWPESGILALRWDRALAYLDEIAIDLGKDPQRPVPVLPEEIALREIMTRELAETKKRRKARTIRK